MASIKRNYFYNLSYQILTLITPFITTPYVTRVLSPSAIGLESFAFSLSQTFGLFASLGMATYGMREISYAQDDRARRTQIFWEVQEFYLMSCAIWIVLYIILVMFYIKHDYELFFILLFNINPLACVIILFYGMEDFGKMTACQFIFKIANIIFIFLFIKKESDLALYVFGSMFFACLTVIILCFDVHKYVDLPDWKTLRPFRDIKIILSLFLPTITVQIYSILDKLMLGFIAEGTAENGYYELALRISRMPLMVVASLGTVIVPRIGYLYKSNEHELVQAYIYRGFKFAWFASVPLCFGLIAISNNFVSWFFGSGYEKVSRLLKISSFLMIIIGLANVSGYQYMIPTGRQNKYTMTIALGALTNFILNLFLIKFFYSYGALIASVLGESTVLMSQLYFMKKDFSVVKIISSGFFYLFAGIMMFVILRSFSYKLPLNPLGTIILIACGALIYFMILFIFRDEFFMYYSRRTINFVKRKLKLNF